MIDGNVREAWERKVEDLTSAGCSMAPVLDAIAADAPQLLEFFPRAAADAALPAGLARRLAGCAPGSFGRAVLDRLASLPDAAHTQREVHRVLLGYGGSPFDDWALHAFAAAQNGNLESLLWISVLFARVGFVTPEATLPVHDCIADGWLRGKAARSLDGIDWEPFWSKPLAQVRAELAVAEPYLRFEDEPEIAARLRAPGRLPQNLSVPFWATVGGEVDPAALTPTIAAFGGTFDEELKDAIARAILRHEGQDEVARLPQPPRVRIDDLRRCAPGTLGHAYYHLIVDNGFDPEVFDPDSIGGFHPGIDGTNRRILQQHEIWHLIAGYSISPLHETAISSFQLAQFGHSYSATFLATTVALLLFGQPVFAGIALQVMAEGWLHGRRTCPLMPIDWFSLWDEPIDELRRRFGIEPFQSVIPDLLAQAA